MAKKQIHELSALGREMTDNDMVAVDTGSATRKTYPSQIRAGVIRDSTSGGDMSASFSHAYLTPAENRPVFLAGMQREASNNRPVIATVEASTVKTLLDVSKVSYADITQSTVTIGASGYVELTKPSSGTPVFAMVATWSSMTDGYTALAIAGFGSHWYLTGTPGVTVTGMVVRYFFVS